MTAAQSARARTYAQLTQCDYDEAIRATKSTPTAVHGNLIWQPLLDGRVLIGHPNDGVLDLARSMHDQGKVTVSTMSGDIGLDDLPEAIRRATTGDDAGCVVVTTHDVAAVMNALSGTDTEPLTSYDISAGSWLPTITVTIDGEAHDIDLAAGHVSWPADDRNGITQITDQADAQGVEVAGLDDLKELSNAENTSIPRGWVIVDVTNGPALSDNDLVAYRAQRVALIVPS